MTRNELADLDREALIDLILVLQAEVAALRLKLEKNNKPPTNSGNSSQPPSQDWKGNLPAKRKRRQHGPPLGHAKHEREFVADPDHLVEVKSDVCEHCQTDLSQARHELVEVNQITELPPARAEVIEVRQYGALCPGCGLEQVGQPPAGLEMNRTFGARLESTVVYYRQEQHLSYQRTLETLQNLHGMEISQGGTNSHLPSSRRKSASWSVAVINCSNPRFDDPQLVSCCDATRSIAIACSSSCIGRMLNQPTIAVNETCVLP